MQKASRDLAFDLQSSHRPWRLAQLSRMVLCNQRCGKKIAGLCNLISSEPQVQGQLLKPVGKLQFKEAEQTCPNSPKLAQPEGKANGGGGSVHSTSQPHSLASTQQWPLGKQTQKLSSGLQARCLLRTESHKSFPASSRHIL